MLSVVIPHRGNAAAGAALVERVRLYLEPSGLAFEILAVGTEIESLPARARLISLDGGAGHGMAVRRGVLDARGDVIAILDPRAAQDPAFLSEAFALVHSETSDVVVGISAQRPSFAARLHRVAEDLILEHGIRGFRCGASAYAAVAARLLFAEAKLRGSASDGELLYLANKYGFRVRIVGTSGEALAAPDPPELPGTLVDLFRVRLLNRRMAYRAPRRCPVCCSAEVHSIAYLPRDVVRACSRCKCRYLADLPLEEEAGTTEERREVRTPDARRRTEERRLALVRSSVAPQGRVLEVGVGKGVFGELASREYEYVGIDPFEHNARQARAKELEVYCSTLGRYINLGAPFDAVTAFRVFEYLPDPHDALAKIKDLLKPGGILILITPDTESLLCSLFGERWLLDRFPQHLILYSRSALIELLETSGFEIESLGIDAEYLDHVSIRRGAMRRSARLGAVASAILPVLPDPVKVPTGCIRIVATRRAGPPQTPRSIRAVDGAVAPN